MNKIGPLILIAISAALLVTGLAVSPAAGAPYDEPVPTSPAPTWTPGPPQTKTPVPSSTPVAADGAVIELNVLFPTDWPWNQMHWQDLWTLVQWQDAQGRWHDVEGWQGSLDAISYQSDQIVGTKVWWAGREQANPGPFRWIVLEQQAGAEVALSEPFYPLQSVRLQVNATANSPADF